MIRYFGVFITIFCSFDYLLLSNGVGSPHLIAKITRETSAAEVQEWAWGTMLLLYNLSFPGEPPSTKEREESMRYQLFIVLLVCTLSSVQTLRSVWSQPRRTLSLEDAMQLAWGTLNHIFASVSEGKSPPGKFYEAAIQITKDVATAHAAAQRSPDESIDVKRLVKYMSTASNSKSKDLARSTLARTLYGFFKAYINGGSSSLPLGLNSISFAAAHFLETIKDKVGEKTFNNLVARNGAKTLAFVIDTTGSMKDDIKAAKAITKAILAKEREENVDFILSPFSDPNFGPVIYKAENQGKEFLKSIDDIQPKGGGDCAEMAFAGILEALNAGPQYGSPLFVITDASAKDDTLTNVKTAKVIAQSTGVTVNFFTKPKGCGSKGIDSFRELAAFTSGQVFPLKSDEELKNMTSFVKESLDSTQIISVSSSYTMKKKPYFEAKKKKGARGRRGLPTLKTHQFPLQVDEFAFKLQVSITTEKEITAMIALLDPKGKMREPLVNMSHSIIYSIDKPAMGTWTLVVSQKVGKFDYVARVKSNSVIQFGYYYVLDYNGIASPVAHPLKGESCKILLTVGGAQHTNTSSLKLRLIDAKGRTLQKGIKVLPIGKMGSLYQSTFTPPKEKYKVVLEGKTRSGNKFTRVSRREDEAKHILLRVLYGQNHFTVVPGKKFLLLAGLHNTGNTEYFKVRAYSNSGVAKVIRSRIMSRKGRMGFIIVTFTPMKSFKPGQTASIILLARGETSGTLVTEVMRVLVVDG